ncbi:MAG: phenylacetate--CoA ligase family protein, partial [Clostridiales bacterium]|nr:phenylacetate--CoA ligase family protein [Clostridiales bacterium]
KRLAFTGRDISRALDFITVAYTTFMHKGDRMMVMMSGGTEGSIGDVVKHSMDLIGAETYIYGHVKDIRDTYEKIREWKPDVITGIPVQMAALARYCELNGEPVRVREVLLSADDVPEAICDRLRRVWGSRVFRHFGMTELCIAGGCECCADMGYHLRHGDHYFEILDPDEEGYGEVAITTFHHEAMPLLRYRTGDFARIDRSRCACGSDLPRLIGPRGRLSNSIDYGSGRLFLRDIEEIIFGDPAVTDFECETDGDKLNVCLKHFPGDMPDIEHLSGLLQSLADEAGLTVSAEDSEMEDFPAVYNSKKKLIVI